MHLCKNVNNFCFSSFFNYKQRFISQRLLQRLQNYQFHQSVIEQSLENWKLRKVNQSLMLSFKCQCSSGCKQWSKGIQVNLPLLQKNPRAISEDLFISHIQGRSLEMKNLVPVYEFVQLTCKVFTAHRNAHTSWHSTDKISI